MEKASSALTVRSSRSREVLLGDVGVLGDLGSEGVEGVCKWSGECSAGVVFQRNNDAMVAPGDLALVVGFSGGYSFRKSVTGIVIGAGEARDTVIFFGFSGGLILVSGAGIDV